MNVIETHAGHFLVVGVAFPDDPVNARAIRQFRGRAPLIDHRFNQSKNTVSNTPRKD